MPQKNEKETEKSTVKKQEGKTNQKKQTENNTTLSKKNTAKSTTSSKNAQAKATATKKAENSKSSSADNKNQKSSENSKTAKRTAAKNTTAVTKESSPKVLAEKEIESLSIEETNDIAPSTTFKLPLSENNIADTPTDTAENVTDGSEKDEEECEEHFIIPEKVDFVLTEPEKVEIGLFPPEAELGETENGLLDVEHFSDYKSGASETDNTATAFDEEINNEYHIASYENLTILNDNEGLIETKPAPVKQKYDDPDRERYNPEKPRKVDERFDFVELFIFTLLAVVLLTTFIFRHSVVEGSSMQNTLQEGEHLIITNLFYTPKRGDIVVCQDRTTGHDNPIVKRIIAIEGDTVEILPNGKVFVNDEELEEKYVFTDGIDIFPGLEKITVEEDTVFVMGDHRNKSSDSRAFGTVREDAILGKVILRFYPFDKFGTVN